MLVDPGNNLWCGKGTLYAYEVCDAVEAKHFPVNGLAMSDFVYPAFFEAFHKRKLSAIRSYEYGEASVSDPQGRLRACKEGG
jgi:hypothetical protein